MATTAKHDPVLNHRLATPNGKPKARSVIALEEGVGDAVDLFSFAMGLAHDVLTGAITPPMCNAAARAVETGLFAIELQRRMGAKPMIEHK